jgi:hypothetical protein
MNRPSLWIRLLLTALGITLFAALIVLVIGLVSGWEAVDYSNGMFIGGGVAIAVAILSAFGGWGSRADFKQMYSQSAGDMSLAERTRLWVQDISHGYNAVLLMCIVGLLLIGLSVLIGSFLN